MGVYANQMGADGVRATCRKCGDRPEFPATPCRICGFTGGDPGSKGPWRKREPLFTGEGAFTVWGDDYHGDHEYDGTEDAEIHAAELLADDLTWGEDE